jgi:hypothetical protein
VLARLERNVALLAFTLGYLVLVLLVLPTTDGMHLPDWAVPSFMSGTNTQLRLSMMSCQLIIGAALLAAGTAFATARRRQR